MSQRSSIKRSKHELKRLIEDAVTDECRLSGRGLWFCVDEVETSGQPPEHIKVWATLHFTSQGSPFCCGEPECHLCIVGERQQRINEHVRRAMGMEQDVTIDFGQRIGVHYHEGVDFRYFGQSKPRQTDNRQTDSPAWVELNGIEENAVWDRFNAQFEFRPSVHPDKWPGIHEPTPSITFDISSIYRIDFDFLECDLNTRILAALRHCVLPPARLYALDWQHPCYWFDPYGSIEVDEHGLWKVPILPNGDYYIFLAEDFTFGIFGHPWEQTMCIFGQKLIETVEGCRPKLFFRVVRRDGQPVEDAKS